MMRPLYPVALIAAILPGAAHAQDGDSQLWLAANAAAKVGETTLTIESNGRFSDSAGGFAHAEIGGLASVPAAKGVDIAIGYRHVQDWEHGRAQPNEERLRQMVTVALGGGLSGRLRFEQRFHAEGGAVGLRLRPRLSYSLPLSAGGVALFASHESFVNVNTTGWGQRGGYDRMRHAIGLSIPLSRALKIDPGYLNQYRFGRDGARDRMDHALTLTLNYKL